MEDIEDASIARLSWSHAINPRRRRPSHFHESGFVMIIRESHYDGVRKCRAGAGSDGQGDEEAEAGRISVDHGLPVLSETTIGASGSHERDAAARL